MAINGLHEFFTIDTSIKELSKKYDITQSSIRVILIFELLDLSTIQNIHLIEFLYSPKQNIILPLDELITKGYLIANKSSKPYSYFLSDKGILAKKAFIRHLKRNLK